MRKSRARESRLPGRLALGAGAVAVAGAGAAVTAELRHRRALAADPVWALLRSPLTGAPVTVRSRDGVELHAEIFGPADAPTFVLVPGWTEELQLWDLLTRGMLRRGFRVVSYDPRGQGSSASDRELDQSIERYAEDLTAVLEATCAGRDDVIVAGHSMGGMTVVAWAASVEAGSVETDSVEVGSAGVSSLVRAVALISTGVSGLAEGLGLLPSSIPLEARRALLTPLLAGDAPMIAYSTPLSRALIRHVMFGPEATAAHVAVIEPMIWRMHPKLRAAAARTMRDLDLSAAVERVDVPALVVVGDSDRLTPPVHARRMVAGLPHVAEFVQLPGTGHMTPLERPDELVEALVRLAASIGLESRSPATAEARISS